MFLKGEVFMNVQCRSCMCKYMYFVENVTSLVRVETLRIRIQVGPIYKTGIIYCYNGLLKMKKKIPFH